jgi:hypothetical protein
MNKTKSKTSKDDGKIAQAAIYCKAAKEVYNNVSEIKDFNDSVEKKEMGTYIVKKAIFPGGGIVGSFAREIIKSAVNAMLDNITSLFK